MVTFKVSGNYKKTRKYLEKANKMKINDILEKYGKQGVKALRESTPKDSGKTADSWSYEIKTDKNGPVLYWRNSNVNDGVPIAILIQYGHATRTGGYVKGRDYINPAIRPIFDEIAESAWKEVNDS